MTVAESIEKQRMRFFVDFFSIFIEKKLIQYKTETNATNGKKAAPSQLLN